MKATTIGSVGLGLVAGAALGMAIAPQKKTMKGTAKKATRVVEDMAHNFSQNFTM